MQRRMSILFLSLGLGLSWFASAGAQDPSGPPNEKEPNGAVETTETLVDPELAERLVTPQACYGSFSVALERKNPDWEAAAQCLDFSTISPEPSADDKASLVAKLQRILNAIFIEYESIPAEPDREERFQLSTVALEKDTAGELSADMKRDVDRLFIARGADGLWRFSAATVSEIEDIHERWQAAEWIETGTTTEPLPFKLRVEEGLRSLFPETLHGTRLLIPDYMWFCLIAVVIAGFIADAIIGFLAIQLTKIWLHISKSDSKEDALRGLWKPLGLLVQALVWYYGTYLIGLPEAAREVLLWGLKVFAVVAAVWVFFRFIDAITALLNRRAKLTSSRFDDLLIPLLSKSLKGISILFGIITCADFLGLPITGLLGGLGIGGAAIALASKDTISNLFGSFTVLVDRPFEIGDWVITEDVEGTVEAVGFRSTRVRTFYNSLITLPNSRLTTAVVDNMGRRRYRRVKTVLGVQYDTTPEQLEAFCEGIRELLRHHPATRKDYFHVYFHEFGASSLDIMLYFFLRVNDWSEELQERHRIFSDILRLAHELGVSFAFPTRTLYVQPETNGNGPGSQPRLENPAELGRESALRVLGA